MMIRMEQYNSSSDEIMVVSLAKTELALLDLLENKLPVFFLKENKIYLYPINSNTSCINSEMLEGEKAILCSTDEIAYKRMNDCSEYSVFVLYPDGLAWLSFDCCDQDHTLMITPHCNTNCVMCPEDEQFRRFSEPLALSIQQEMIRHIPDDPTHFTITGGEPFLVGKAIFGFLKELKEKFYTSEFLILTNGRIFLLEKYASLLKENIPGQSVIGIPIHGSCAELHDLITQVPGSFEQTIKGIDHLLQQKLKIEIRIVVSKLNYLDITSIADLVLERKWDIDSIKFMGLEMLGNANVNKEEVWIPYEQAFTAAKPAILRLIQAGKDVALYNFPLCAVEPGFRSIARKSISTQKIRFPETCKLCKIKDACGGVFAGTYRLAEKDLHPCEDIL